MAKKINISQLKSQLRQIENKQKQAINKYNQAVRDYNRAANNYNHSLQRAVNDYNAFVRKYNSNVRRSKQIIQSELRKLNSSSVSTGYTTSARVMQQHYEEIDRVYYEGASVTPEQESILDLVAHEQANSLLTENYINSGVLPADSPEDIEIGNKLALFSDDLNNRWKGAVFALNPNNPDATRHFCTSTREIFTEFLELRAPDALVFEYNPNCAKTDRGNATRKEKIKYIMRNLNMDDSVASFADADIKNILELNQLLSGGTHGPAGKFTYEQLLQVKKRVEQGINFLCEIAKAA